MIHRRGVLPVLLLLALVVIGAGMQIALGSAASPGAERPVAPAPTPAPAVGPAAAVVRSLAAVQRAFNAGDLPRLCRGGGLVDPAVIRRQDASGPGCEAELEALIADVPPLRLTVNRVSVRPDLATAEVTNARGQDATVDLVRRGGRWLLSFSGGSDPMPVLAGTA
jgi:hypothetical protein